MALKQDPVGAQNPIIYPIPMTTKYLSFHQPEARPVPVLGEVHGSLPLDGEAAAPEQFLPVSVLSEVVEQLKRPVDNVTWVKVEIATIKSKTFFRRI